MLPWKFPRLIFHNPFGVIGLILCGAALGFLPYNFNPAKIFMGDSGSMFLGYTLAVISITGTRHISNLLTTMLVPVLILAVPIFDTVFVMLVRKLQGKRIFEGGRDHTSHRMVTLGLSQRKTVALLYTISIVFGLIAISYSKLNIFIITIKDDLSKISSTNSQFDYDDLGFTFGSDFGLGDSISVCQSFLTNIRRNS